MEKKQTSHSGHSDLSPAYLAIGFNSLASFLFGYFAVLLVFQFSTVLAATNYRIHSLLDYTGISWITSDFSPTWTHDSVFTIFISGTLILVILSGILYFLLFDSLYVFLNAKLLLLWLFIHTIVRVSVSFVVGNIFNLYSSNLVADWLYMGFPAKFILSLIILSLLMASGAYFTGVVLLSSNSNRLVKRGRRKKLVYWIALLPWLMGSLIISLVYFPAGLDEELWILVGPFLFLAAVFVRCEHVTLYPIGDPDEPDPPVTLRPSYFLIALAAILAFRLGLNWGITL